MKFLRIGAGIVLVLAVVFIILYAFILLKVILFPLVKMLLFSELRMPSLLLKTFLLERSISLMVT